MSFAHITFCVWYLIFIYFFIFLRLLLHDNHIQPICTFLSCTVMLILIFKSTVYYHAHYFIFCSLYLFFIHFILCILLCVVVFYNICTVHGADLTHISLLVNTLCIIVYVTNKSWTWTWSHKQVSSQIPSPQRVKVNEIIKWLIKWWLCISDEHLLLLRITEDQMLMFYWLKSWHHHGDQCLL